MYGLAPGHSDTATGQATLTSTITAPAISNWRTRVQTPTGANAMYAMASAGTIIQPWSILVMKARPTKAPAHTRCLVLPDSSARTVK